MHEALGSVFSSINKNNKLGMVAYVFNSSPQEAEPKTDRGREISEFHASQQYRVGLCLQRDRERERGKGSGVKIVKSRK